jgi:hypothetical protein
VENDRYDGLLAEIRREFPGFRLVVKSRARSQVAIHHALVVLTFGGMRRYLDGYQTTIGRTVYVTDDWERRDPDARYVIMRHERVHLRQFRRFTLPGMALLYLLLPLPLGLAWFRARFEREAYAETIRAAAEVWGTDHVVDEGFKRRIVEQFTGPAYGWMWPFRRRVERWYDDEVRSLAGPAGAGSC